MQYNVMDALPCLILTSSSTVRVRNSRIKSNLLKSFLLSPRAPSTHVVRRKMRDSHFEKILLSDHHSIYYYHYSYFLSFSLTNFLSSCIHPFLYLICTYHSSFSTSPLLILTLLSHLIPSHLISLFFHKFLLTSAKKIFKCIRTVGRKVR